MVLQTLATMGAQHGYAIAARLEQVSRGAIQLNMGTLYPALMRLEQRGLVRGKWGVTDTNRRARFYALTAAGRRTLDEERRDWQRLTGIMDALLRGRAHRCGSRGRAPRAPRPRGGRGISLRRRRGPGDGCDARPARPAMDRRSAP